MKSGIDLKSMKQIQELEKSLLKLGPRVAKKVTNKAMTAARKPVVKAIRSNVPVRTGELKKSIGSKQKTYKGKSVRMSIIGARSRPTVDENGRKNNPAFYAHLVEFGTATGTSPTSFMRKGWDSSERIALARFIKAYRKGVAAEAKAVA